VIKQPSLAAENIGGNFSILFGFFRDCLILVSKKGKYWWESLSRYGSGASSGLSSFLPLHPHSYNPFKYRVSSVTQCAHLMFWVDMLSRR
jgi:hypothetical protein